VPAGKPGIVDEDAHGAYSSTRKRGRKTMTLCGPDILARTLSATSRPDRYGNLWQYHSRSDHHSKVACFGIVLDLLQRCGLLRRHVAAGEVAFGINH